MSARRPTKQRDKDAGFFTGMDFGLWDGTGVGNVEPEPPPALEVSPEHQTFAGSGEEQQQDDAYSDFAGDMPFSFDNGPEPDDGFSVPESRDVADLPMAQGRIIALFGCRGGAGTTTVAINMAAQFAKTRVSTCLVDLDLQMGDVCVGCGLEENNHLSELSQESGLLDEAVLKRGLTRHDSGFFVLSQGGSIASVDSGLPERLPNLLRSLANYFDVVILDGLRDFSPVSSAAIRMADQILLVVTPDVPAVRRAARVIELCRDLQQSVQNMRLILNRNTAAERVPQREIERALDMATFASLANDFRAAHTALEQGMLLRQVARGCALDKSIRRLTKEVWDAMPRRAVASGSGQGGMWGMFARWLGLRGAAHAAK